MYLFSTVYMFFNLIAVLFVNSNGSLSMAFIAHLFLSALKITISHLIRHCRSKYFHIVSVESLLVSREELVLPEAA